ncbi:MAG: respiratory nitrate reductase subunit gamma [Deltaproteobacteria bacterium]|nr:respiratory nitrate reductase subunit gamma [Deltaproteobacteria bacterium]
MTLTDVLLFVLLPYIAVGQLLPALLWRARREGALAEPAEGAPLSSERKAFASSALAAGAIVIGLLHLVPLLAPPVFRAALARPAGVLLIELIGFAGGLVFLSGAVLLTVRRARGPATLATSIELAACAALVCAALAGVACALSARWGSAWYARAVVPYLYSLLRLQPDTTALAALGFWPRAHLVCGFVALGLLPFTTLPRQLRAPLRLARPPATEVAR